MSLRLFPLAVLLVLGATSCGLIDLGPPSCSAATCTGCCQDDGTCVAGTDATACGISAGRCDVCVTPQTCQQGACRPPSRRSGTGGGAGGTGGGGGASGATKGRSCATASCCSGACKAGTCVCSDPGNNCQA